MQNIHRGHEYFNFKLSSARMRVEQSFGLLKNRWRMLTGTMLHDATAMADIVTAACVLHNLLIDSGDNVMDFLPELIQQRESESARFDQPAPVQPGQLAAKLEGAALREQLYAYMKADKHK